MAHDQSPVRIELDGERRVEGEATYTIDCATCVMRNTAACHDCVVTFLCEREPTEAILLDLAEMQALRRLARAGLAPGLRHVRQ